jgi:hypothetical protein
MSNEQLTELLPCPFCGGTETKEQRTGADDECVFIQCITCEAGGPTSFPRQDNDTPTWNSRLSSPSPVVSAEEVKTLGALASNIISALDNYGRTVDAYEYGLPHSLQNIMDMSDLIIPIMQEYASLSLDKDVVKKIAVYKKSLAQLCDEDALYCYNLFGGPSISDKSKIHQVKDILTTNRFYTSSIQISGRDWKKIFDYLESKGYIIA